MSTLIEREPRWYAIYTKSRNEKKVSEKLTEQNIQHFLPLHKILKQWSDRKKWVEEPLFKSYLFVFIGIEDYYEVLKTEGVVTFVKFGGKIEHVDDRQIAMVRQLLGSGEELEISYENFELGDIVQVKQGPMMGMVGNLVDIHGNHKLVISIDIISQNLLVKVPKAHTKKLSKKESEHPDVVKLQEKFRKI